MASKPPPLKRARIALLTSQYDREIGAMRERAVSMSAPIAPTAHIVESGTEASFGSFQCKSCVSRVKHILKDRADPIGPVKDTDRCFFCKQAGHWACACPLDKGDEARVAHYLLEEADAERKARKASKRSLPSLLELCVRAVVKLPADDLLANTTAIIPAHVAADQIVPRLPLETLDRFFYEQPPLMSGTVTDGVHALAQRRFAACLRHTLFKKDHSLGDTAHVWDVFAHRDLLFGAYRRRRRPLQRRQTAFLQSGEFRLEGLARATTVVRTLAAVHHNLHRLSHGLVTVHDIDKDNIVVAGGAALGSLVLSQRTTVRSSPYAKSDIDIFILDAAPEGVSLACMAQTMFERVIANYRSIFPNGKFAIVFNSNNFDYELAMRLMGSYQPQVGCAVTLFFEEYGVPNVQVIVKKGIATPAELFSQFDIDCCGVGIVRGGRVVASPRATRALALGYNIFEPMLSADPTHPTRLYKYAERGFPVFIPAKLNPDAPRSNKRKSRECELISFNMMRRWYVRNLLIEHTYDSHSKITKNCKTVADVMEKVKENGHALALESTDYDGDGGLEFGESLKRRDPGCFHTRHFMQKMYASGPLVDPHLRHVPDEGFDENPMTVPIVPPCDDDTLFKLSGFVQFTDRARAGEQRDTSEDESS